MSDVNAEPSARKTPQRRGTPVLFYAPPDRVSAWKAAAEARGESLSKWARVALDQREARRNIKPQEPQP